MCVSPEDFNAAAERSVIVVCDSWDEVQPSVRDCVIKNGGLVDLLFSLLGPALRSAVMTSRPDAIHNSLAVLGSRAIVSEHWVLPFEKEDFRQLAYLWMKRSAYEAANSEKLKLKARHDSEAQEMISEGLKTAVDSVDGCVEALQRMRLARHHVVARHELEANSSAEAIGKEKSEELVNRIREVPELQELTATPVLATMLCACGDDVLLEVGKRLQAINRGEVFRIVLESQMKRELETRLENVGEVPERITTVTRACQEMALQMTVNQETHMSMREVRKVFLHQLRLSVSSHGAAQESHESSDEKRLVDAMLLCSPLRVGRLREMNASVSFSHLSFQEFFLAQLLVMEPSILSGEPCCCGLNLGVVPSVRAFVRDLFAHSPVKEQDSWISVLRTIVEKTRGDEHTLEADSVDSLWSGPEGGRCRASANAMTLIACVGHAIQSWDLSGCRFPGAYLDGLQVLQSSFQGVDVRHGNLSRPRLVNVDLREASLDKCTCGEEAPLFGHTDSVRALAMSPDGTRVVSGSDDDTFKVWNLHSRKEEHTIKGHTGWVNSVAMTLDGTLLVSGSRDKTIKVWDCNSWKEVRCLSGHTGPVNAIAITPDGTRVVSGSGDETVKVWSLPSGEQEFDLTGHTDSVRAVLTSPDGMRLVSGGDDCTIKVWILHTGKEERSLRGHDRSVRAFAVTSDGTCLASGSDDRTIKLWNLETGREKRTLAGHIDTVSALVITPDGTRLISGSWDTTMKIWNLETGNELRSLTGHIACVYAVTLTPEGECIVSGSEDKTIKVWNLLAAKEEQSLGGHSGPVNAAVVSPDQFHLFSGGDDKVIRMWNLHTGIEGRTFTGHAGAVSTVAVTPDGARLVSGSSDDKTVKVWNVQNGKEEKTFSGHTGSVRSVAVTADGSRIVSASGDNTIIVWDAESGAQLRSLRGHSDWVNFVVVTKDGTHLFSGSDDRTIKAWNLESGEEQQTLAGHMGSVRALALSPDGARLGSGSDDSTIKVWSLRTWKDELTLCGHGGFVRAVLITPDGRYLVSGSDDNSIKVWNLSTGLENRCLKGHTDFVRTLSITSDGKSLASGSWDKTIRLWSFPAGDKQNADGGGGRDANIPPESPSLESESCTLILGYSTPIVEGVLLSDGSSAPSLLCHSTLVE
eukprot:RCo051909